MEWDAKLYDSVISPQIDAGRKLIGMATVGAEEAVLDLGCGTGILTAELASLARWGRVVGVDRSAEMLDRAQSRLDGLDNVSLTQGDARTMVFEGAFDLVFSSSVLHWIENQEEALRRIHNALKPGGRAAIQIIENDFFPEFRRYTKEAISEIGAESHFEDSVQTWYMPTREEYEAMLRGSGFIGTEVTLWEQRYVFPSVNDVLGWLLSTGLRPYLARLPEREQERFKYAFAMRFEDQRTDRGIEVMLRRLFAIAKKEGAFPFAGPARLHKSVCC